jgi:prepilin-type N-terminal cleavage/methylation domain-containing protein
VERLAPWAIFSLLSNEPIEKAVAASRSKQGRRGGGNRRPCLDEGAFTLVELLVVIAIIGILAALLLPVLTRAKQKAHGIMCMSNHRQLAIAWQMYVNDNRDQLPFASHNPDHPDMDPYVWVPGTLDYVTSNNDNWDPDITLKKSLLWPYCGNSTAVWKCPADRSIAGADGERVPRVRSMSMNLWVGGFAGYDGRLSNGDGVTLGGSVWRVYLKMNEFIDPGPARTFLLLDVREDSIDWGNFATDMRGWPGNPGIASFYDLPGSYHGQAGGLSFVDGHAEIKHWEDSRTMPPLVYGGLAHDIFKSPDNPDILWLQERATRRR